MIVMIRVSEMIKFVIIALYWKKNVCWNKILLLVFIKLGRVGTIRIIYEFIVKHDKKCSWQC